MLTAITRAVSPRFNECEVTHVVRTPIDLHLARAQHRQYEQALERLGATVHHLPAEPEMPDSVFVEDTAIVLAEIAVIARPGSPKRRAETRSIEQALTPYRRTVDIAVPGTIDGGDVLRLGKTVYVGLSARTNESGIEQMRSLLHPHGYTIEVVPITSCLHLKSAVTQASADSLLINPDWIEKGRFAGWKLIEVDPDEPAAANILYLPAGAIYPSHFPRTRERLESAGMALTLVNATEVAKAEGSVTCCSLIFEPPA
jgi:dimethylargininase